MKYARYKSGPAAEIRQSDPSADNSGHVMSLSVVEGPTVTVATVALLDRKTLEGCEATGEARRRAADPRDPKVGRKLAIGRALIELGEEYLRQATEAIDHPLVAYEEYLRRAVGAKLAETEDHFALARFRAKDLR